MNTVYIVTSEKDNVLKVFGSKRLALTFMAANQQYNSLKLSEHEVERSARQPKPVVVEAA